MRSAAPLSTVDMFCKAVEKGSFSAAAATLGSTPSAVSKAVQRLETHLGTQLFQRTTRSIRLTDAGRLYYESCRQALQQIVQVEDAVRRGSTSPMGVLRLSLPYSYAIRRVVPLLPQFLDRHRGRVSVQVRLSNFLTDFVADDIDLAIRLGEVADSRLVARRLHDARFRVVASPTYLREHGTPAAPADLHRHRCVDLILPDAGRPIPWLFGEGAQATEVKPDCVLSLDHPLAVLAAARAGAGIVRLLDFTVDQEVMAGELVEVLAEHRAPAQPISAVYPRSRFVPQRVRAFLDFLVEALGGNAPLVPPATAAASPRTGRGSRS